MEGIMLDSNILIYAANPGPRKEAIFDFFLEAKPKYLFASEITRLEVFGYHDLGEEERKNLEFLSNQLGFFPITKLIIEQAISIRQQKKMSLADSVIAVTCIINNLTLFTYNQQDFQHLDIQLIELPENKNDQ